MPVKTLPSRIAVGINPNHHLYFMLLLLLLSLLLLQAIPIQIYYYPIVFHLDSVRLHLLSGRVIRLEKTLD